MRRIGIDVGGTNTDAVLVDRARVVHAVKTPTTEDVTSGVLQALRLLVEGLGGDAGKVDAVMIGTTHFTNAVVQRRDLMKVAALRIGLPASASLPPFIDWPEDLAEYVNGGVFMVHGGHEYDGRELSPFDATAVEDVASQINERGIRSVAISAIFSPLNPEGEVRAAEILARLCPGIAITRSHDLGRIGLLERENVALLNACLQDLASKTTRAFVEALAESGIQAPLYLTQNDGTVMLAEVAERFPVYSFASGPTNSMRGAAFLSGLADAMVVDVGGTTTDIGFLVNGFPRQANNVVQVGGVRTLFRMPDLLSVGLGGGTLVREDPLEIGPDSVGYRLTEEALVFGGETLTTSDIAVAAGMASFGDASAARDIDLSLVRQAVIRIREMVEDATDRMKTDANPVPLVAVGGGAFLIPDGLEGVTEVLRVEHNAVANAVGAAIAQVSAEVDQIFNGLSRDAAMARAVEIATDRAVESGAARETIELVSIEDLPIAYLPGDSLRVHARV
ncbi:MAG: hydantoinase/oxoprolinase N-terminal domain-containing protein, partial [Alphaproteobacteria bacterium]